MTEEKPKVKNLIIEMPAEAHRRLRYAAFARSTTMKAILMECVNRLPEPPVDTQPNRTTDPHAAYDASPPKE